MLILPSIDLLAGVCVRLIQGDYDEKRVYDSNPADVAARFAAEGASWIHVVDLDGAKTGEPANLSAIKQIVKASGVSIEVGGGVRTLETARRLLDLGVARVIVGTKLVQDLDLAARLFADLRERIVAGLDARDGKVATSGWLDQTDLEASKLAETLAGLGCRRVIVTDISRDGMLNGPNLDLLRSVGEASGLPVIASGGVGSLEHVRSLSNMSPWSPEGAIIGRAIYERKLTVAEAILMARGE
jgi:phosphoribosylformimino-5-aminoimidazole carboxamide ribotide isomerase